MNPLDYTKAQLAVGAGAFGASSFMNRTPPPVAGSVGAAGADSVGPRMADGSFYSGTLNRSSMGRMSSFNPWSFLAPVLGAGADIWSARKMAEGQDEANATNLQSARENMAFEASQSAQQMAFQAEMSNTAHQREVADLRAAGLNPVLSANSGASTPVGASGSGAQASVENATPDYRSIVPKGIDTAVRLKQMQKDFESADSSIYLNAAAADREESNAKAARGTAKKLAEETRREKANADITEMAARYAKTHRKTFDFGQWLKYMSPFASGARDLATAASK